MPASSSSPGTPSLRASPPAVTITAGARNSRPSAVRDDAIVAVERDRGRPRAVSKVAPNFSRVLLDLVGQVGAHDVLEARVVLDLGRVPQLAARDALLEHQGRDPGAARVQRGGLPGRAGADDDDLVGCLRAVAAGPTAPIPPVFTSLFEV